MAQLEERLNEIDVNEESTLFLGSNCRDKSEECKKVLKSSDSALKLTTSSVVVANRG